MDKERSGLITNGPPAPRLCGLPIVGEVRVALDRDRRVVDIRDDVGHRRGDIRLQGRYWGLTRPRPLKDSLRRQVRPSPLRDDDNDGSASDAAAVGERPCFLLPLWLLLLSQAKHHHGCGAHGGAIGVVIVIVSVSVIAIANIINYGGPRGMRHKRHILF